MFDAVRGSKRAVKFVLLLLVLPFAFWGVESYFRDFGRTTDIAHVDSARISSAEFDDVLRSQQNRLREQLGPNVPNDALDSPELRRAVLDSLIRKQLLQLQIARLRLSVGDAQVQEVIASAPELQQDGRFSIDKYRQFVQTQNMTPAMFEARLRDDLLMRQLVGSVGETAFVPRAWVARWARLEGEARLVREHVIAARSLADQLSIDDATVEAYYRKNIERFRSPEQVRVDYVVLDQQMVGKGISITDDEIKQAYESNAARYAQAEQRRASHILIQVPKDASASTIAAARTKLLDLRKQLLKDPAAFARLAKAHSEDPGSKDKGGDLGFFGRGAMVKPFEDVVFGIKEGEISDVVRTDFGLHLIRVTGIQKAHQKSLAEAREDIAAQLRNERAARAYAEAAEGFSNTVYEQSDSLQPVVDKYHVKVRRSDWITAAGPATAPFDQPKLRAALFAKDVLTDRRNTPAIDVGGNVLVAARLVDHKPAAERPLADVKADIVNELRMQEAAKKSKALGEARLEALRGNAPPDVTWSEARTVSRAQAIGPGAEAVRAIFRAGATKLPAYVGVEQPGQGYVIYRIESVMLPGDAEVDKRLDTMRDQLVRVTGAQDFSGYLASLRARANVEIKDKALDPARAASPEPAR